MRMSARSAASRLERGSSKRKIFGSRTMARPMATRWRWPPESMPGFCCSRSSRWRMRAALSTLRRISSSFSRSTRSGKAMFSKTLMCG